MKLGSGPFEEMQVFRMVDNPHGVGFTIGDEVRVPAIRGWENPFCVSLFHSEFFKREAQQFMAVFQLQAGGVGGLFAEGLNAGRLAAGAVEDERHGVRGMGAFHDGREMVAGDDPATS